MAVAMALIFSNRIQSDANDKFQSWRQANWSTGEFLTCATRFGVKVCKLHIASSSQSKSDFQPHGTCNR